MIFYSIRRKLIISFLLLTIVPLVIIAVISYLNAYKAIEERVSVYSQQVLIQTTGKLDNMLKGVEAISLQIVSSPEIQSLLKDYESLNVEENAEIKEKLEQRLGNIICTRNDVVGVNIIMLDSEKMFISGETLINLNEHEREKVIYQIANSENKLLWTSTYRNDNKAATYTYISTLARAINDPKTGKAIGIIEIGVKEFAIADTFSYIDLGPTGFVFVVDKNGAMVSHLQKNLLTKPAQYTFMKRILTQTEDRERTFAADYEGERVLVSYSVSEVTGWYIISVVPYSYLMSRIEEAGKLTFAVCFAIMLIAILISLLISYSVSKPVEKLGKAMKRVEEGDLNVNVDLKKRNEIEALGENFNKMINKINSLIQKVYESEITQKEAEINALQSQINPHFLYNTLALIDGIASIHGEKEISIISQALGDIFRYSISGTKFAEIDEEIKIVKLYLYIHELRYNDRFSSNVTVDENTKKSIIAKLLIEPIVENAIIHGIEEKRGNVYINVDVSSDGDDVLIIIEDNGVGMSNDELETLKKNIGATASIFRHNSGQRRYHIGLGNVNRRIKLYYGEQYGINIESWSGKGTKVTVRIPARKQGDDADAECAYS